MDPRDAFAKLAREIEDLPPEVQYDRLIRFFAAIAKDISDQDIEMLRRHFEREGNDVSAQLAEVLEGQLALRRLGRNAK